MVIGLRERVLAVPAAAVGMPPDPALWRAVLPDDTPVRPTGSSDRTARPVITYPSAGVRERVLSTRAPPRPR